MTYKKFFHFYPFGVPIVSKVLGVGGTELPRVWYGDRPLIGPCQVCFRFPIKYRSSQIRQSEDDLGRNLGQNLGHFSSLVKKGGKHGSNVCRYFMNTAGGLTVAVVLAGACWGWAAGTEDI